MLNSYISQFVFPKNKDIPLENQSRIRKINIDKILLFNLQPLFIFYQLYQEYPW